MVLRKTTWPPCSPSLGSPLPVIVPCACLLRIRVRYCSIVYGLCFYTWWTICFAGSLSLDSLYVLLVCPAIWLCSPATVLGLALAIPPDEVTIQNSATVPTLPLTSPMPPLTSPTSLVLLPVLPVPYQPLLWLHPVLTTMSLQAHCMALAMASHITAAPFAPRDLIKTLSADQPYQSPPPVSHYSSHSLYPGA